MGPYIPMKPLFQIPVVQIFINKQPDDDKATYIIRKRGEPPKGLDNLSKLYSKERMEIP